MAARISHFLPATTKFSCSLSNMKIFLLCFLSLALDLFCPFSRWASLACRLLSPFLCLSKLYIPNLWTWRHRYRNRFRFPFSSWLTLCFTRHGWLRDFSSEITSSCIWVAIPVNWVVYIGRPVVRTDARSSGRALKGTWLPKFLGWVDDQIFLR